jgi:hypothetical protein
LERRDFHRVEGIITEQQACAKTHARHFFQPPLLPAQADSARFQQPSAQLGFKSDLQIIGIGDRCFKILQAVRQL